MLIDLWVGPVCALSIHQFQSIFVRPDHYIYFDNDCFIARIVPVTGTPLAALSIPTTACLYIHIEHRYVGWYVGWYVGFGGRYSLYWLAFDSVVGADAHSSGFESDYKGVGITAITRYS